MAGARCLSGWQKPTSSARPRTQYASVQTLSKEGPRMLIVLTPFLVGNFLQEEKMHLVQIWTSWQLACKGALPMTRGMGASASVLRVV